MPCRTGRARAWTSDACQIRGRPSDLDDMWLLTTRGFYSVVARRDDPSLVLVRARVQDDLEALRDLAPSLDPWYDPTRDYPWRAELPRDEWAGVAAALAREIDYGNFKNAVAAFQGHDRADLYALVWDDLRRLETGPR